MSFGLSFVNSSGSVVLDTEFSRMCVIASGTLASGSPSANYFGVTVTTQEPPLVFVRPTNPNNGWAVSLGGFVPIGSPGAWTGFYTNARYVQSPSIVASGDWFACQFGGLPVANFGLRLWDANSKLLFDSGTPSAVFTRAAQNFSFVKIEQSATTSLTRYYSTPFDFSTGEYQLINQFGMTLLNDDNIGRGVSTWWDWPTNTLWAVTAGFSNPIDFHVPALFAKRTVN